IEHGATLAVDILGVEKDLTSVTASSESMLQSFVVPSRRFLVGAMAFLYSQSHTLPFWRTLQVVHCQTSECVATSMRIVNTQQQQQEQRNGSSSTTQTPAFTQTDILIGCMHGLQSSSRKCRVTFVSALYE